MQIIWSMDGLLCLRSTTTSFWHSDAVRGPSTPTDIAEGAPERVKGAGFGLAQVGFDLGKGLLNGVHIGTIGGQEQKPGALLLQTLRGLFALVDREVVEDHHVAFVQRWCELCLDVGVERRPADRAIDHPGRTQLMTAQPGDKGVGLPLPEGSARAEPLALAERPRRLVIRVLTEVSSTNTS